MYLTNRWAAFYAGNPRAALAGAADGAAIIRVRIDPTTVGLFPDEDYLKYLLTHPASAAVRDVAESIGDIQEAALDPREARWLDLGFTWERSFREYGSVATPYVETAWVVGYHAIRSWEEFGIFAAEDYLYRPFPLKNCPYGDAFKDELERRTYVPLIHEEAVADAARDELEA